MTDEPSESDPTCSEDYTLEESMWHKLSFKIVQKPKGIFLVGPLGELFLAFQMYALEFGFSLLVIHFCLEKSGVGSLGHLTLTLSGLEC